MPSLKQERKLLTSQERKSSFRQERKLSSRQERKPSTQPTVRMMDITRRMKLENPKKMDWLVRREEPSLILER